MQGKFISDSNRRKISRKNIGQPGGGGGYEELKRNGGGGTEKDGGSQTCTQKIRVQVFTLNCCNSYTFGVQTCIITERGASLNLNIPSLHP